MKKLIPLILSLVILLSSCQNADVITDVEESTDGIEDQVTKEEEPDLTETKEDDEMIPEEILNKGEWRLVWHDEFDGDAVNMDNWGYDVPTNGRWNGEIQSYTENNAYVEDGILVMEAREESITEGDGITYDYSSSKMITQGKQTMTYGRIEVNAKIPYGQGIWPAIWMMPEDEPFYGTWPICGEIDIMEALGHETDRIHGTVHFGEPHRQIQGTYVLEEGASFSDNFHTYAIEWEPGEIRWYIDDIQYHKANDWFSKNPANAEEYAYPAPFDQEFFLIMNISIGGGWPGNPDETTIFPQQMLVDYVRVYDKAEYTVHEKPVAAPIVTREPLADGNYIYNGSFTDSDFTVDSSTVTTKPIDEWTFLLGPGGEANFVVENGVMHAQIAEGGLEDWAVQMYQTPVHLEKEAVYEFTFDAKAEEARDIKIKIGGDGDRGWVDYAAEPPVGITTEWTTVSFEFTMQEDTDPKARAEFNMGLDASDVWITNVKLVKVD